MRLVTTILAESIVDFQQFCKNKWYVREQENSVFEEDIEDQEGMQITEFSDKLCK